MGSGWEPVDNIYNSKSFKHVHIWSYNYTAFHNLHTVNRIYDEFGFLGYLANDRSTLLWPMEQGLITESLLSTLWTMKIVYDFHRKLSLNRMQLSMVHTFNKNYNCTSENHYHTYISKCIYNISMYTHVFLNIS